MNDRSLWLIRTHRFSNKFYVPLGVRVFKVLLYLLYMFALCSNWCLWYSWSPACIWLQWISVKNTVESYFCVFYIRHDLLSYILTEFKLTILPFVLVLSQEVCSSSWSPFFSQLRNTVWYTLSSWNEKQNIVILLTTVVTNKSSVSI